MIKFRGFGGGGFGRGGGPNIKTGVYKPGNVKRELKKKKTTKLLNFSKMYLKKKMVPFL